MTGNNKKIRFWRGTSESYELLKRAGMLSYWTRYSVKYNTNGVVTWKEFYGDNPLTEESGQLLPVIDIVPSLAGLVLNPGDRYWVSDNNVNVIVNITVGKDNDSGEITLSQNSIILKEGISVRVKNRGYKSYFVMDNEILTYDEIDGGSYDSSI